MIQSCEKQEQQLCGTMVHGYNCIQTDDGKKVELFTKIVVETIDGNKLRGEIAYIAENYFDILPFQEPIKKIYFSDVKKIAIV